MYIFIGGKQARSDVITFLQIVALNPEFLQI